MYQRRSSMLAIICSLAYLLVGCGDGAKTSTTHASTTHKQFIETISKAADVSNADIIKERKQLLLLYQNFVNHKKLSAGELKSVEQLAKKYHLSKLNFSDSNSWKALLNRVDVIPNSLVIAQAANESAWGTSRFAKDANNYFGVWCYSKGCGIVPGQRAAGATHEVRRFSSVYASVAYYMNNLNRHHAYAELRHIRAELRRQNKKITGYALAQGLSNYSERGHAYVVMIGNLINSNVYHLASYDNADYLEANGETV